MIRPILKVVASKILINTLLILSFFMFVKCENDSDPKLQLPPEVWEVSGIEGSIGFWGTDQNNGEVNKYFIGVYVPGTIDASIIGIVDDLPAEFMQEDLQVVFSGTYTESESNPMPFLGGQMIYSLAITKIELAE